MMINIEDYKKKAQYAAVGGEVMDADVHYHSDGTYTVVVKVRFPYCDWTYVKTFEKDNDTLPPKV